MRTFERSTTGLTADDDGIAQDQTTAGAADLTLNGASITSGAADFRTQPRRVQIKSGADLSAITFTVYGTDRAGSPISEAIVGPNVATVTTNKVFATVTRVAAGAAVGSNVRVGFSAEAISSWIMLGSSWHDYQCAYEIEITGTANVDVEQVFRNLNRENVTGDYVTGITAFKSGKSASENGALTPIPAYVRLKQNSGSGSAKLRIVPTHSL